MTDDIYVDLRAAGLPTPSSREGREDLAKQLGFSYKHLDNVMSARKPYGGRLKTTIRRWLSDEYLSAAKSEQTQPAPLSPLNKDEPDPVCVPIGFGAGFRVEGVPGGGYRITQTVAECVDQAFARKFCDFLNKEAG